MTYLTFPQFQASRVEVPSVQVALSFDDGESHPGFIYEGGGWIAKRKPREFEEYFTVIERSDWLSGDLAEIELILWAEFYLGTIDGEVVLGNDNGTLDDYVRGYFTARSKPDFDGGLMGDLFSERDLWTLKEAEDVCYSGLNFEKHWEAEETKVAAITQNVDEDYLDLGPRPQRGRRKVVIEVLGGVAECTECPPDVDVEIIDHDNEEADPAIDATAQFNQ